jgi:ADP-ribose pyrophosphatase
MTGSESPPSWPLESSEKIEEYEMFGVRHDRARNPADGSVHDVHVAESPGGVVVIALTGRGEMVLVEQFRHGIRRLSLEAPAGIVDEGEDPVEAGLRELSEETGFVAERGELLGTLSLNPSWQATRVDVVLARDAEAAASRDLDDGEDTRVRQLPPERVRELVRSGEIDSAVSLAALLLFDLQR